MTANIVHETISIDRLLSATKDQVFTAWSDPDARSQWGPPSDSEAIEFLEHDLRRGGMDVSMCGQKGDLRFRVETLYHDIEKLNRLLFTERVLSGDSLLCVSQITVCLQEQDSKTQLTLKVQIASLVGEEMIAGNRNGWNAALDNLARLVE